MTEVRFDRMAPGEVVPRREACNLAYLPVGSLEWHGPHMPFGTDYMTVTYLAEEAARRYGGVVFPPIYYSDVRYYLQECRREWRESYLREMQVPGAYPDAFPLPETGAPPTQPDDGPMPENPLPFSLAEQGEDFARQIARAMLAIHLYGFTRIMLLPGHGPNPGPCRRAEEIYRENVARRSAFGPPARTLMWFFIESAKEHEPLLKNHWIHADKWEGSLVAAMEPGLVHPEVLPEDRAELAPAYLGYPYLSESEGYNPECSAIHYSFDALDPRNIDAAYGKEQLEALVVDMEAVVREFVG